MERLEVKKLTSSWGGSRYAPNVFAEQGVYMLMTILKGELAANELYFYGVAMIVIGAVCVS